VSTAAKLAAALGTSVRTGVRFGDEISLSQSYGEHLLTSAEAAVINSVLGYAASRQVSFIAPSGDSGAISYQRGSSTPVKEVNLAAFDPLALAAGCTGLTANPVPGTYVSDAA
jgi:hypothetical protein